MPLVIYALEVVDAVEQAHEGRRVVVEAAQCDVEGHQHLGAGVELFAQSLELGLDGRQLARILKFALARCVQLFQNILKFKHLVGEVRAIFDGRPGLLERIGGHSVPAAV